MRAFKRKSSFNRSVPRRIEYGLYKLNSSNIYDAGISPRMAFQGYESGRPIANQNELHPKQPQTKTATTKTATNQTKTATMKLQNGQIKNEVEM